MTTPDRLADPRLGQLNRGLLGFRIALYLAVIVSLYGGESQPAPLLVAALVVFTFFPAIPVGRLLDYRIEVAVATSLAVACGLWWQYGSLLAIEFLPLFSLTVSGLLLPKRRARTMVVAALILEAAALVVAIGATAGLSWPGFHAAPDILLTRIVLTGMVAGVGIGFLRVGAVLRDYQKELAERTRTEVRLTEVVRHKNNLINSVAHELRTPLTAVFGFSSALGDAALDLGEGDRAALARTVADESRRLVNVVDNLIVEARFEATGLESSVEPVELDEEIQLIWEQFRLEHGWELRIEGAGTVWADRVRLRQLLTNLVDNAVSVGEPPLRVAITARSDLLVGQFENGGLPVFEPFGEPNAEAVPTVRGRTGLGLRAARTLARSMRGDLRYLDGAFVLSLPRHS